MGPRLKGGPFFGSLTHAKHNKAKRSRQEELRHRATHGSTIYIFPPDLAALIEVFAAPRPIQDYDLYNS